MDGLHASIGDVVAITGERATALKLMPAYPDARGKGLIQIDGIARENAGAGLDDRVRVELAAIADARTVTLSPIGRSRLTQQARDATYVGRLVDGLVVQAADRIRVNLFGSRPQDFTVESTTPRGFVLIQAGTRIQITGESAERRTVKISYEDIGGLGKRLRVREIVELPLKYPELFDRLGIDAPKGIRLNGAPGCGKTLMARAVAHETEAHFFSYQRAGDHPQVLRRKRSSPAETVRRGAARAPSIIFLDEIDAIAPRPKRVEGDVEKRVVAQFLALMDGLTTSGQVVVLAATNLRNVSIPPCAGPAASIGKSRSPFPTAPAAARSSRSTPAVCPSRPTSTPITWPPSPTVSSAPTWRPSHAKRQ